jgi:glycosyltransferase involved in cell wall biosynthesis
MKEPALRLVVYLDASFRAVDGIEGPQIAIHPSDYAFVGVFLAEVARHFQSVSLLGRLEKTPTLDNFVPLPGTFKLVPLPHYSSLAELGAVARATPRTTTAFSDALDLADVVWIYGPHPFGLILAALAARRRKPVVLGIRQDTLEYFRARLPSPRWRPLLLPLRAVDAAFVFIARRTRVVVAGLDIAERFGGEGDRVLVLSDSAFSDRDLAEAPRLRDWSGRIDLLTVGRIDAEKNPLLLVDVLAKLGSRYHLTCVGSGPMENELIQYAAEQGVADRLKLRGWIPFGSALLDLYRGAHVFAHVSLTEGVPRVLFEALACAAPVVATDVGGVRSALDDGQAGLLVPPHDAPRFVEAIERIVEDEPLRNRLVNRGLRLAHEHTREVQAARVAAFIERAINSDEPP